MAEANMIPPEDHDYPSLEHLIIWLDIHIGKPGECTQLKNAFASNLDPRHQTWTMLTDRDFDNLIRTGDIVPIQFAGVPFHLLAFDDSYRCYEAFERHRDKHIYFITSGSMGEHMIPMLIENHRELFVNPVTDQPYYSIYVFCGNIEYHSHWLAEVCEYVQTFDHEADLLQRMTRDIAKYFVDQGEQNLKNALRRYQHAKKVFDQYTKLGGKCKAELDNVEKRMADVENILRPRLPDLQISTIRNEDDIQPSQPSS